MAFPGVPLTLDVAIFILEGTPNESGRVLIDTGTYAVSMKRYWPGESEDVKTFEDALKEEGMTVLVDKGMTHRTIANGRTVNLCIEKTESDTIFLE